MKKTLSGLFRSTICFFFALLLVAATSAANAAPQTPKTLPTHAATKPFTQEALIGTWKKSNGLALFFYADGTFKTSEGDGGVSHGPYVISGDTLALTYIPDGPPPDVPVPVLTYRVVFQGSRMLLFLVKQDLGNLHQIYMQDNNPKDHKIVMMENGVKKTAAGGAEIYIKSRDH
jgi:hypothetical protein